VQDLADMDHAMFERLHEGDQMAVDKLKQGIDGFAVDQGKLEALLEKIATEQGLGSPVAA
jgi:transaldolase